MKKSLLGLFVSLLVASLLHALPPGVSSIPFTTSQAQFAAGDAITIQEVFATSSTLGPGTTVVVRGTYTLASRASAVLQVQLTSSAPAGSYSPPRLAISAGSGTFELEHVVQQVGTLHVTFYPATSGSSFGGLYFAAAPVSGQPTTPITPPSVPPVATPQINTAGLSVVPFATSQAKFEGGDSITLLEVLASSPRLEPGDTVVVRGQYSLQSRSQAVLMISLTVNAPGATEPVSALSRMTVDAGPGGFELAYVIRQPGALHVTFYPSGAGGSSFGGVYFAPPGTGGRAGSNTVAINNPTANTGKLANLSIRSLVGPGEGALVAGMTVTDQERYVVIRGIGPSLSAFGVSGALRKPLLTVHDASGEVVATAGSWSAAFTGNQRTGIQMTMEAVGAFPLAAGSDDAVLNLRLVPGGYTVTVTTGDGQPGVVLLEIYASATYSLPTSP